MNFLRMPVFVSPLFFEMSNIPITNDLIRQIKAFLNDGTVPKDLATSTQFKFKRRYGNGDWKIDGEILKYQGKIVVPKEDEESTLQRLYENPLYTQQSGARLWNRISNEYAFISRSDCTAFLENKRVPQIMKKVPRVEIPPPNVEPRFHRLEEQCSCKPWVTLPPYNHRSLQ
jgi:hypothetical protein